jgi:DNA (cytosine-5)-methyltransferase 1
MRAVELFAGAGGLGLGVSRAGFQPSIVAEWNQWCCDTIRKNREHKGPLAKWPEPFEGDVRDLNFRGLLDTVDLVSGGPPCQPFSLGGKHHGHTDKRDMWSEAVRAVREIRPKAFIFENVKGLTRSSFAGYLNYIVLQLSYPSISLKRGESWLDHSSRLQKHHTGRPIGREEYRVVFDVINAADFGVPQRRERIVFVGFRSDLQVEWSFPKATHSLEALLWSQCKSDDYWEKLRMPMRERTLDARMYARGCALVSKPVEIPWQTTRNAIGDLPDPELKPEKAKAILNHKFQSGARSYPGHTGSPMDEPAKTIKAGVHGVPGGENMLVREDGSIRYFTVRETARLQTFPDEFVFQGSWSEAMRQLGNAVPVDLAIVIAKSIKVHLRRHVAAAKRDFRSDRTNLVMQSI